MASTLLQVPEPGDGAEGGKTAITGQILYTGFGAMVAAI
jgi:hypothetical protein